MTAPAYRRDGPWGGYSVRPSRTGWVVRFWSRMQDGVDGRVLLLPYSERFARGNDLNAVQNRYGTTLGEIVAWEAGLRYRQSRNTLRVIRHGQVVR